MAGKNENGDGAVATPAAGGGGIKPWIPLLANLILMPVLAYCTVVFVLAPKLQSNGASKEDSARHESGAKEEGSARSAKAEKKGSGSEGKEGGKIKYAVPLSKKVIVNLAKSQMTRYLLADITVVGNSPALEDSVKTHDAELRNAAIGVLYTKTISDLEQPQAMNQIRSELLSMFSNILGNGMVKEIYLTEFAVQ